MPTHQSEVFPEWPMFCSQDGSYGDGSDILLFKAADLSVRQWEIMESQSDYDRYLYVQAILEDDKDEITRLEEGFDN